MTTKLIFLSEINFKDSPVVRFGNPNKEVVEQYAESYTEKKEMPPIVVFYSSDKKQFYLADGRHRCAAVESIGRKAIMANIHEGELVDALKFALLANAHHGVPRTQADRRKCIEAAILQWPQATSLHIATMTATSDKTVTAVRKEMEEKKKVAPAPTRVSSSGAKVAASRSSDDEEEEKPRVEAAPRIQDKLGRDIPFGVAQYWGRTTEIKEMIDRVEQVRHVLKVAADDEDEMYAEINFTGAFGDLERLHANLSTAIPYAVCTVCQGQPQTQKSGCRMCFGRGLISKFRYDTIVAKETKAILEKPKKK